VVVEAAGYPRRQEGHQSCVGRRPRRRTATASQLQVHVWLRRTGILYTWSVGRCHVLAARPPRLSHHTFRTGEKSTVNMLKQ